MNGSQCHCAPDPFVKAVETRKVAGVNLSFPYYFAALALIRPPFVEAQPAQALTNSATTQLAGPQPVSVSVEQQAKARGLVLAGDTALMQESYRQADDHLRQALSNDPEAKRAQFILFVSQPPAKVECPVPATDTNQLQAIELPKVEATERLRRFQSAVSKVLEEHGFTPPLFLEKPGGLRVAVCARPRLKPFGGASATSAYEVLEARVETTADNRVALELVAYAWVGSGYAILGKLFQDGLHQEQAEIARQLKVELSR